MNTNQHNQEKESNQGRETGNQEKAEISLPKIDRPEGPFEHSGETAGWTKEEKEEKAEQSEQEKMKP